ncbi:SGNH/GDSL hydrolase family protein [Pseudopedobacter sp.]|uniref:SGNH/GDSL hydrolase family protein n=1 Tax=Pseudopedobacter sp. TaxID=1936787 RepID=UPI003341E679
MIAASYDRTSSSIAEIPSALNIRFIEKPEKKVLDDLLYFNGFSFRITGKYHQEKNFNRLPAKYEKIVRPAVWGLSKNSSGISIHFTTNSPVIAAKWKLMSYPRMSNMTPIAASGLDLYCLVDGQWQYVNSGIPSGLNNEKTLISDMDTCYKEFLLNLPLYDGVENIEIGINPNFSISAPENIIYKINKPIVFYGTSITQGASASRPGMVYTSIISRKLSVETINLGFSGNGRFESSVGQALCEIDASLFVIDCTANSHPDTIKNNTVKLLQQIRECKPNTPILLVESIIREYSYFKKSDESTFGSRKYILAQNNELKKSFNEAKNIGIDNLYYLESDGLIGYDHEGTIDGTHLTDLGSYRMAEKMETKIIEILKLK